MSSVVEPSAANHQRRALIEQALEQYLNFPETCPDHLGEAIRYAVLSPGKRLRPQLVLMSCASVGGEQEQALPAACALEMIHAYSLVHDDLPAMDDDDLRRGRPTCHKVFGEDVAILVGDALIPYATQIIAEKINPPEVALRCLLELSSASGPTALVAGQAADLASNGSASSQAELEAIHRRKTGALFLAAVRIGAIVGNASTDQLRDLSTFGTNLGLAFQVTDDLLDVAGDPTEVGKRLGKDADAGKSTYPQIIGVAASRSYAKQLIDNAINAIRSFGNQADPLRELAKQVIDRTR